MEKLSVHQLFLAELDQLSNVELSEAFSLLSTDKREELLFALLNDDADSFEKILPGSNENFNDLKTRTLKSIDDTLDDLKEDPGFQSLLSQAPSELIRLIESEADMASAIKQSERAELKSFLAQIDLGKVDDFEEDLEKAIISSERRELRDFLNNIEDTYRRPAASLAEPATARRGSSDDFSGSVGRSRANRRTHFVYIMAAASIIGFVGLIVFFYRNNPNNNVPLVSNNDVVKDSIQTDIKPKDSVQDPILHIPDSKELYAEYELGQPESYGFSSEPPLVKVTIHDLSASIDYLEEQIVLETESGVAGLGPKLREVQSRLDSLLSFVDKYVISYDADPNEYSLHYFVKRGNGNTMSFYKKDCALFGLDESIQTDLIIQINDVLFSLELTEDKMRMKKIDVELDPDCE
jgi:hypothetical protein